MLYSLLLLPHVVVDVTSLGMPEDRRVSHQGSNSFSTIKEKC